VTAGDDRPENLAADAAAGDNEEPEVTPEPEPEPVVKAEPEKKKKPDPPPDVLKLTAHQYGIVAGEKLWRIGGWAHWAREKVGAGKTLTRAQWKPLWDEFWARPIR
jgi:hypothetical protein